MVDEHESGNPEGSASAEGLAHAALESPQDLPSEQVHESRSEENPAVEAEHPADSAEEADEAAAAEAEAPADPAGEPAPTAQSPEPEPEPAPVPQDAEDAAWPQDVPAEEVRESRTEGAPDPAAHDEPAPGQDTPAQQDADEVEGDSEVAGEPATRTPERPRRRAASRPAGPPPLAEAPSEADDVSGAPEPDEQTTGAAAPTEPEPEEQAAQAEPPVRRARRATRPVTTVAFSAVQQSPEAGGEGPATMAEGPLMAVFQPPDLSAAAARRRRRPATTLESEPEEVAGEEPSAEQSPGEGAEPSEDEEGPRRRRRRGGRRRRRGNEPGGEGADEEFETEAEGEQADAEPDDEEASDEEADESTGEPDDDEEGEGATGNRSRRRRRRRRAGVSEEMEDLSSDDPPNTVVKVRGTRERISDDIAVVRGSTRIEAKRQRRRDGREAGRRRPPILTESEFLARREAVRRVMAVRDRGDRTQIAVLEDGVLVEHYVNRIESSSQVGNVYLGKVQNVLPSMEAAFVDIGQGRNAVLYAGEVNWDAAGLEGQPKRIELALKAGDSVLVQVTKDPIGHKGARLTSQISLPGRFLVYVPEGSMTGISRKLPDTERARLKGILKSVVPDGAGVIVRTAAEGASEDQLTADVHRLTAQWGDISKKVKSQSAPALLYGEPDLAIKVVRDIFNEDFTELLVQGENTWSTLTEYLGWVAPDLVGKLRRWTEPTELFAAERVDEQLAKALDRKVWLPSGGSLVIDRTEAMTVVDVNTGKFTGQGGNLEETVTRNNLEAAEEIVRQLRLRDIGGIIVIDFIDMVLESNRDLVLRRLIECLGRDRTRHQVAEVTSLGLVQMTRKRIGQGLLEVFSEPCEACGGRGYIVHTEPLGSSGSGGGNGTSAGDDSGARRNRNGRSRPLGGRQTGKTPPAPHLDDEGHVAPHNDAEGAAAGE